MLNSTEISVLDALKRGMTAADAATHVGVTASFVHSLSANTEFANELAAHRMSKLGDYTKRDDAWNSVEDKAIAKLKEAMELPQPLGVIIKVAQIANNAKRRGASGDDLISAMLGTPQSVVSISMPARFKNAFVVNATNEITEIGGRKLETIDAVKFVTLAEKDEKSKGTSNEQILGNSTETKQPDAEREIRRNAQSVAAVSKNKQLSEMADVVAF